MQNPEWDQAIKVLARIVLDEAKIILHDCSAQEPDEQVDMSPTAIIEMAWSILDDGDVHSEIVSQINILGNHPHACPECGWLNSPPGFANNINPSCQCKTPPNGCGHIRELTKPHIADLKSRQLLNSLEEYITGESLNEESEQNDSLRQGIDHVRNLLELKLGILTDEDGNPIKPKESANDRHRKSQNPRPVRSPEEPGAPPRPA